MSSAHPPQTTDVVVLGTGIAGLNAAVTAMESGATVRVIDRAEAPGGSSQLSAGMYWTAPTVEAYRARIPKGDLALGTRIVRDYPAGLERLRASGVHVNDEPQHDIMTFGIGYSFDVRAFLEQCRARLTAAGSPISLATTVESVALDDDGLTLTLRSNEGLETLRTRALVLATGGFQGDRTMLAQHMGPNADRLLHRANATSSGDGLSLARSLGADVAGDLGTFYGHLMPSPLASALAEEQFLPLSQYYSERCILVDVDGRRCTDETMGDEILTQDLLRRPHARGVLIFDERVRAEDATAEPFPGLGSHDRYAAGVEAGAAHAESATLEGIADHADALGVDAEGLRATLAAYRAAVERGGGDADGVPVAASARVPSVGTIHAIQVQPAITFTFGGIRIDDQARALDAHGTPVPGLLAAGADIGGLSNHGYAGGLAPAFLTGGWAGATAAAISTHAGATP